jgi:hypothetical protein
VFMLVQAAALLICYGYELPLQKRLRGLLVQRREVARGALQPHSHRPEYAMPRSLFLPARNNSELARDLQAELATELAVVLMDRRLVERRRTPAGVMLDRRRAARRARP